ncbi:MAG: lipid-A-disaccharide synthase [Desulfobacteraceae bacterium]|nr:lipid-A-disaccharide synthase [Desulfobacteraceae bacterium]
MKKTYGKEPELAFIVAGEASGDLHGSHVVRLLKQRHPQIRIMGVGGRAMKSAGAQIVIESDQLAVVGITEVFSKLPVLIKSIKYLKQQLTRFQPNLLILIDFPDFNLHLAAHAKKHNIPVLYYISPQIWAWRSGRIKKIKKRVDHMAVILPFEKAFYEKHNIPVSYVGHPLMDGIDPKHSTEKPVSVDAKQYIGILPGSRDREVYQLLPLMLDAAGILEKKLDNLNFLVSCAPSMNPQAIEGILQNKHLRKAEVTTEPVDQLFKKCRLVFAASGTVTLQAAIHGTPMIITYIVSPLSFRIAQLLVNVEHIGLVNLIAGKRIVPELIQEDVTSENIAHAARNLLTDDQLYRQMCSNLNQVKAMMGKGGASLRVADIACRLMGCSHKFLAMD